MKESRAREINLQFRGLGGVGALVQRQMDSRPTSPVRTVMVGVAMLMLSILTLLACWVLIGAALFRVKRIGSGDEGAPSAWFADE